MSGAPERVGWAAWQAAFWARAGKLHATSVDVTALLDEEVGDLLYWSSFGLDASVELDDLVQMLALAQLEAQVPRAGQAHREARARQPTAGSELRAEVQRRLRRAAWQVRRARGRHHRADWDLTHLQNLAGPDGGLGNLEDLTWDDVVRRLGWRLGLAVWLTIVEEWTLEEVGELEGLSRQQIWRRVRRGLARLRRELTAPR